MTHHKKEPYEASHSYHKPLNVRSEQAFSHPPGYKHQWQRIPSVSTAAFGSYFTFQIKQREVAMDEIVLEFNVGALANTGNATTSTGLAFNPAWFWFTRIDYLLGSEIIDSIYPIQNFVQQQWFCGSDEKRTMLASAAGDWKSQSTRAAKTALGAATFGSDYML